MCIAVLCCSRIRYAANIQRQFHRNYIQIPVCDSEMFYWILIHAGQLFHMLYTNSMHWVELLLFHVSLRSSFVCSRPLWQRRWQRSPPGWPGCHQRSHPLSTLWMTKQDVTLKMRFAHVKKKSCATTGSFRCLAGIDQIPLFFVFFVNKQLTKTSKQ